MQRDVVLRWIDTISALIARILRRDPTVTVDLAQGQLDEAKGMLLGPVLALVPHLTPSQVADLLADPFRIYGYAQLLALESAIAGARSQPVSARHLADRAIALAREAIARSDPTPAEWLTWVTTAEDELGATPE